MALDHEPHIRHARKALGEYDDADHLWSVSLNPGDPERLRVLRETSSEVAEAMRVLLYEPADGWQPEEG